MSAAASHYNISWDEFHRDTRELAKQLLASGRQWKGIIAIARGGLAPAAILARELDIRLVDTICIASYQHDQQGEVSVLKQPEGDGEGFLLVDDLVDSGKTAKIAKELLPKADFVAIYAKPAGKPMADQYLKDVEQQVWLHFPWDIELSYAEPLADR